VDWEKKSGIPTPWKKIVWKILASRDPISDDSLESSPGKIGIHDYLHFFVGSIVCEHDGRTYFVEGDWRVRLDDDDGRGEKICGSLRSETGLV